MTESIIKPKEPKGYGWIRAMRLPRETTMGYEGYQWVWPEKGFTVFSALEVVKPEIGPEYHLSISKNGGRCSRNEARFITKQFGMQDAEEDNHVPGGFVRNFWLPVNENLIGVECPCKAVEPVMRENKGDFEWRGITE